MPSKNVSRPCAHPYPDNRPCRAWAVRGSDPPRCAAHRLDGGPPVGAPPANQNRQTHGFYSQPAKALRSIDDVVADALQRQSELSAFIEQQITTGQLDIEAMAKLLALHGQNASRIGRLLRDKRALSGASADGILGAIAQALDELSTELGIVL